METHFHEEYNPQEAMLAPPGLAWAAASDRGRVREENEDAWHIVPELGLFLVSDGMGGHQGGALASRIVATDLPVMIEASLHRRRSDTPRTIRSVFQRCIVEQSRQLRLEGRSETGYRGMGATLVLALVYGNRAYIGNLGDSRVYLHRRRRLRQLSRDHSVVAELLEQGHIEPEEAPHHDAQGQITHYVGMDESPAPHIRSLALRSRDRLLLCTDGLTDMLAEETIARTLTERDDPQAACDHLITMANEAGGYDNVTAMVIDYRARP